MPLEVVWSLYCRSWGRCKGLKQEDGLGRVEVRRRGFARSHELRKGELDQMKDHSTRLKWADFLLQGITEENDLCILKRQIWL